MKTPLDYGSSDPILKRLAGTQPAIVFGSAEATDKFVAEQKELPLDGKLFVFNGDRAADNVSVLRMPAVMLAKVSTFALSCAIAQLLLVN